MLQESAHPLTLSNGAVQQYFLPLTPHLRQVAVLRETCTVLIWPYGLPPPAQAWEPLPNYLTSLHSVVRESGGVVDDNARFLAAGKWLFFSVDWKPAAERPVSALHVRTALLQLIVLLARVWGAVCLKNCVTRWWKRRAAGGVSEEEKTVLRAGLVTRLEMLTHLQITKQQAMTVAKIARNDWPDAWPALFPDLLSTVRATEGTARTHALLFLYAAVKEISAKARAHACATRVSLSIIPGIPGSGCSCEPLDSLVWGLTGPGGEAGGRSWALRDGTFRKPRRRCFRFYSSSGHSPRPRPRMRTRPRQHTCRCSRSRCCVSSRVSASRGSTAPRTWRPCCRCCAATSPAPPLRRSRAPVRCRRVLMLLPRQAVLARLDGRAAALAAAEAQGSQECRALEIKSLNKARAGPAALHVPARRARAMAAVGNGGGRWWQEQALTAGRALGACSGWCR